MANLSNINNKFLVTTGGNVGIGVTGPVVKLELQDTTHTTMKIRSGNNDNILFLQAIQGQDGRIGTETNNDLGFYTNGADRLTISNTGNVGIGTDTPNALLELKNLAPEIRLTDSTDDSYTRLRYDGSAFLIEVDDASGANDSNFRIQVDGSERLRIDSSGNVGIGTNSPDYPIDVSGIIRSKPRTQIANISGKLILASDLNSVTQIGGIIGTISFTSDDSDHGADFEVGKIEVVNQNPYGLRNDMTFTTRGQADVAERMRIQWDGNVGIGTASPDVKLHVYNGDSGATTVGGASDELILENDTDCGLTIRSGTSSDGVISFADSGDHNIGQVYYSHSNNSMTFRTNDNTAVTIDSSQRVGIGITSPNYPLEVNGTSTVSIAYQRTGVSAKKWGFHSDNSNTYWQNLTDGNLALTIANAGNIGIGTTSPSTDLHVNSENAEGSLTLSRGGNNMVSGQGVGSIVFPADYNGTPTNYGKIVTYANALSSLRGSIDFKVKSTSGNLLTGLTVYGTSSGPNVGIGTTSPSQKLEVNGIARAEAVNVYGAGDTTSTSPQIYSPSTGDFAVSGNGSEKMRITSLGDIQIPTNSASIQLRGSGSSSYTSIRRDSANELIVANTAGNQIFGIKNTGELSILPHGSYSAQYTYTSGWNSSMQTLIPGNQLSPNAVYIVTIKTNSLAASPYYASTVFHIATSSSTNGNGGSVPFEPPTATHVSSNAVWKIRISTIVSGHNGVEGYLIGGPTNFNGATIYVRATKIMTL